MDLEEEEEDEEGLQWRKQMLLAFLAGVWGSLN